MLSRCSDSGRPEYPNYGGRGIIVCERWKTFENFYEDMGTPPEGMTLERKENGGNYEPENCHWATRREQQRNMRRNRLVTFRGETQPLVVWCERTGLQYKTLQGRIFHYGWTVERALTAPLKNTAPHRTRNHSLNPSMS